MELEILKNKQKRRRTPHYKLVISFMEGDADGDQEYIKEFDEKDVENLKLLALAVECISHAYPNGRGGSDEYNYLPEYDAYFGELEDIEQAIEDEEVEPDYFEKLKLINPKGIRINHPSDSNGISTSFTGFELFFIDEDGDSSNVKVTFDANEKKRILECEKFFK